MKIVADELRAIVREYSPALLAIPEQKMVYKPSATKWSYKEIMGHLADSAQNNIRRFIVAQYEDRPTIVYNQDKWVAIAHYQEFDTRKIITLWQLLNEHIAMILEHTDAAAAQRTCQGENSHTLEGFAIDYIKHLKHHLHQVLEREPIAYP